MRGSNTLEQKSPSVFGILLSHRKATVCENTRLDINMIRY